MQAFFWRDRLTQCVMLCNFGMNPSLPWWKLNPWHDLFLTFDLLDVCLSSVPGGSWQENNPCLGIYVCHVWCVAWPYWGSVAQEYKTSPRESDIFDHSKTDDMTFITHQLLTTLYPHSDLLTTLHQNLQDLKFLTELDGAPVFTQFGVKPQDKWQQELQRKLTKF